MWYKIRIIKYFKVQPGPRVEIVGLQIILGGVCGSYRGWCWGDDMLAKRVFGEGWVVSQGPIHIGGRSVLG